LTACTLAAISGCGSVTIDPPAANGEWPAFGPADADAHGRNAAVLPVANVFGELPDTAIDSKTVASEFGFQQHTATDEGYDAEPTLSPDGRWMAFTSTRHDKATDLYLQKTGGQAVTQLTSDTADDAFPTFSPDATKIAFSSNRNGSWDLYTMTPGGKNIVQVTSGPSHDMHPSFSPDGTRLVYCSLGARGQWELWTVTIATGERRQIGYGLFPSWSPQKDKDMIAFQRARNRGARWFSIWSCELQDGEARQMTEVVVSTNAAVVSPCWSPDGSKLAFATVVAPNTVDAEGKPTGQQDIWTVDVDGGNRHRLTDGRGINTSPNWGRDGRVYFVSNRAGTDCIWSVSLNAAKPAELAAKPAQAPLMHDTAAKPAAVIEARDERASRLIPPIVTPKAATSESADVQARPAAPAHDDHVATVPLH
jgi:Tol biopolymer transport system component